MNTSPATIIRHLAIGALAVGSTGALLAVGPAGNAAALARSTVTIQAEGVDLSGTLSSTRDACVDGRKVIVFKQVGTRGGGNDVKFASDTAELDEDGFGEWNVGNTGTEGKFYAKVRKTSLCKADTSPTVRAERND